MLQTFDVASSALVTGRRPTTTVPAQALFVLNSDFVMDQAAHAAGRLLAAAAEDIADDAARVALAYQRAFARPPSPAERREAVAYIERMSESGDGASESDARLTAWTSSCQALMASAEFRYLVDAQPPSPRLSAADAANR